MDTDVDLLARSLGGSQLAERLQAAGQLARLGREAQAAAVPLVRAMADPNEEVRQWASAALEELGPPRVGDLEALNTLLADPNADLAYWAATLLGRLAADAAAAVQSLADAVTQGRELAVRERAAWALGQIGPLARSASGVLEQAAQQPAVRLARLARESLARIRG